MKLKAPAALLAVTLLILVSMTQAASSAPGPARVAPATLAEAASATATAAPAAAAASQKLDIKEIQLDNGLRIFVLERAASPTFAGYVVDHHPSLESSAPA